MWELCTLKNGIALQGGKVDDLIFILYVRPKLTWKAYIICTLYSPVSIQN